MKKTLQSLLAALCFFCTVSAQPTTGLVAYWPMNGNFNDAGPNALNGTNNLATVAANNIGTANTAMAFVNPATTASSNVVNQYGFHPINSLVNFGSGASFTISFNVYFNSPFVGNGGIYDNNLNTGGYGCYFVLVGGFHQINFNWRGQNVQTLNGAAPLATWLNICCVATTTSTSIYVNGVLNATKNIIGTATPNYQLTGRWGTMTAFGFYPAPYNYNGFNGKIDEFRTYNRVLTAAEIAALSSFALPVKLTSFTAQKSNTNITLQWQTDYEQNSSHFNIQRSTDGINFTTIGTVQAKGSTSLLSQYQFTDNTTNITTAKTIFYRLQQIDKDGRSQTSNTLLVKMETDNKLLTLLQNPVINDLHIHVSMLQKQNVQLVITDAAGRAATAKQINMNAGQTFTALPVQQLTAGTYFITVTASTQKQTLAFIKQ